MPFPNTAFSLSVLPAGRGNWISIDRASGRLQGTYANSSQAGTYTLNITAVDTSGTGRALATLNLVAVAPPPVVVAPTWSGWSDSRGFSDGQGGTCSVACGVGTQSRTCTPGSDGAFCSGPATQSCNVQACPSSPTPNPTPAPAPFVPDYSLNLSRSTITIPKSSTGSVSALTVLNSGPTAEVSLLIVGDGPQGMSATWNTDNRCSPSCLRAFTISVSANTPTGSYPFQVVGSGGKKQSFTIVVP